MLSYHEFTEKYAHVCEEFMTLQSLDESRDFLIEHGNVMLQENASNYLLLASLEDEMNGFRDKMRLTARQSQLVSSLADLAKSLKAHPGNVIVPFFRRMEEREHFQNFMAGVETFIENLIKRAVVKKKEMDEERARTHGVDLADLPKEERLGPGGLDPLEVFESLPESMQEAFESRDTDKLKQALMSMSESEAEYHMKRCVDSGLWNE
jgi:cell division cycle protein 37